MNQDIFIICRQNFYCSTAVHYQVAEENPVVAAFGDFLQADAFCDRVIKAHLLPCEQIEVINYYSSTGLKVSYVVRDAQTGLATQAYNIIKEYVL